MLDRMTPPDAFPPSIEGCLVSLERCHEFVESIDPAIFATPTPHHGTIGAHLRHCIEYYRCFFSEAERGVLEYDARDRDPILETDLERSKDALIDLIARLRDLPRTELDRPVRLRQVLAPGAAPEAIESSVKRELMSLSDHTIHHLAILTQIAEVHGDHGADPDLGVAYSTEAHRASAGGGGTGSDDDLRRTPGADRTRD